MPLVMDLEFYAIICNLFEWLIRYTLFVNFIVTSFVFFLSCENMKFIFLILHISCLTCQPVFINYCTLFHTYMFTIFKILHEFKFYFSLLLTVCSLVCYICNNAVDQFFVKENAFLYLQIF